MIEIEYSIDRKKLMDFMEERGYTYAGGGAYAAVFESNRGFLVKVYGTPLDHVTYKYNPLIFYRLCKKINNKFVPKFGTPRKFKVDKIWYIALPTEKLSNNPTDKAIEEYSVDLMFTPLKKLIEEEEGIRELVKKHGIDTFNGLYETVTKICKQHDCDDLDSPFGQNYLYRGNTIVITDPWAYT